MADKKEVSILLLGIVAILAIVGLVLLFTSPAATGKYTWNPPAQIPPTLESPAGVDYATGGQYNLVRGGGGNAVYISRLDPALLDTCPNGKLRTEKQTNMPYEVVPGYYCKWFECPGMLNIDATLACAPIPGQ